MRYILTLAGRGTLPFTTLHGQSLLAHALDSLPGDAESIYAVVDDLGAAAALPESVTPVVIEELPGICSGRPVLLHDPLCPLTPRTFVASMMARFRADNEYAAAAHRPVTDTIKEVADGCVAGTVDRERLAVITSPLLLSAAAVADLGADLANADLAALASAVRRHGRLTLVKAPSLGRRVDDESAVKLLACVEEMSRTLR